MEDTGIQSIALSEALASATGIGCDHSRSPGQAVGRKRWMEIRDILVSAGTDGIHEDKPDLTLVSPYNQP